ncbi:MAG TPA: lysophospholipid acyltransferase family protein [Spirochaetota bacterium]|nr:lysophospholipid acyltransferase family protein [Spirochaetota bacterium]HOS33389.1 lysophospholipid acyltransferase family protein [Spirochaetota bacterium]HOS56617.1 lysophospholipid acyltransferase family protein [Spirochaetota bacterium]HPK62316.1 lysophospholipid acyltransferase family protein [Spirochaetota bacterium]HQF78916.1 lysophospholipid acyltransferase family protein [Spirochaetota bacterium]
MGDTTKKKSAYIKDKIKIIHVLYSFIGYLTFISVNLVLIAFIPLILIISLIFDRDKVLFSYAIKIFYRIFYFLNFPQRHKINMNGLKKPQIGQRRIYILNHASIFDVILMSMLPGAIKGVMKESYVKLPLIGWIAVISGNIILKEYMDAGEQYDFFVKLQEKLERGIPIVIYPEGTRSKNGKIAKFYDGAFKLALDAKADIVPVVLDTWNVIRPGAYWIRDVITSFEVLDTIPYDEIKERSYRENAKIIRTMMIKGLLDLRDKRRSSEKNYYRKADLYEQIDNEMREEYRELEKKYFYEIEKAKS